MGTKEANTILTAALAEPEGEPSTVLRLIDTIKYLVGIAERGEGRKARDDELPEQFVLGYVKRLEAALAEPSEAVYWQWRRKDKPWANEYIFAMELQATTDDSEVRKLFTHPASKPEPQVTTDNSATLANALAEIERLKAIHEINADTLNAMQVEIEQRDAVIERQSAALRVALDALMHYQYGGSSYKEQADKAITTIKEALS